jgi:PKD domain
MRLARAIPLLVGAVVLLAAPPALAAPTWLAPVDLSPPAEEGFGPNVASAPGGEAIAVWTAPEGGGSAIRAAIRPPGGPWGAPVRISTPGSEAFAPTASIDAAGDATVIWETEASGKTPGTNVEAASLVAGGPWGPPGKIGSVGEAVEEPPALAADAAGEVTVVWARGKGAESTVEATSHPVGGGWSPPQALSVAGEEAYEPQVAVDPDGDAAAVWKGGEEAVESAERPVGGEWSGPASISASGEEGVFPRVGLDAAGDATVTWERTDATNFVICEADRSAAGGWSVPRRLSPKGVDAFAPALAVDPGDDAVVAWELRGGPSELLTGVANRTGAAAWSEPTTISSTGGYAVEQEVDLGAAGEATVTWTEGLGKNSAIDAATRPAPTAAWSAPVAISTPGGFNTGARLAVDPDGDAFVVWPFVDNGATERPIRSAAYDAAGPVLGSLLVPTAGTAGRPLSFSVAPLDAISPVVATTWSFGDGGSAATAAATHTYSSPGTYAVTVTAVDAAGNTSSAGGQVTVGAAESPPRPATPSKPRKLQVKVSCPKSARPDGCKFALQVVSAKPRRLKAKGKGRHAKTIKSTPESALVTAKVAAGKGALVTLTPKAKFATKLDTASTLLVRQVEAVKGTKTTSYRRIPG